MSEHTYLDIENLNVYRRLCDLHIQVCDLTRTWPREEQFELGSQVRRSSNSAPAQLAEKNDDRHIRNKIEGVNRARGEAAETIHHLYVATMKSYISRSDFEEIRGSYKECIRMLNGLEKSLEKHLPGKDRRWPAVNEEHPDYGEGITSSDTSGCGNTVDAGLYALNTEH